MPDPQLTSVVAAVLKRAPEWIRRDLSQDEAARARAEETLAAMIAASITENTSKKA